MILRNAVIAHAPRRLDLRRELVPPPLREPTPPPISTAPEPQCPPPAEVSAPAPLAAAPAEPAPEPMTAQRVATWLCDQSPTVRAELSAVLAEDIAQVYASAEREGYEAGYLRGEQQAHAVLERCSALLRTVVQKAEAAFAEEQRQLAEGCVDIVAAALAKVAGPLLASREAATLVVLEILTHVKEGRDVTIRVSPGDHELIEAQQVRLAAELPGRRLEVVADTRVDLGGCIVESTLGSLDGRLEVQLRGLFETLRAAKAEAGTP